MVLRAGNLPHTVKRSAGRTTRRLAASSSVRYIHRPATGSSSSQLVLTVREGKGPGVRRSVSDCWSHAWIGLSRRRGHIVSAAFPRGPRARPLFIRAAARGLAGRGSRFSASPGCLLFFFLLERLRVGFYFLLFQGTHFVDQKLEIYLYLKKEKSMEG